MERTAQQAARVKRQEAILLMQFILELLIPFDILDARVHAALTECVRGYVSLRGVDFTREQATLGSLVYRLQDYQLGDLGGVQLWKVGEKRSEMVVVDPPRPLGRRYTPQERKAIKAIPERDKRHQAIVDLDKTIWGEQDELHRRRKERQERVVVTMFNQLQHDPTWKKAGRTGGPTETTQIRGQVFKRLKDEHPKWTQTKVAVEAQEILHESVTADTVRNTYRAMGWEWERGDRVR